MSEKQPEAVLDPRQETLRGWLAEVLAHPVPVLEPASSDASFRRYFRLRTESESFIVMDAPPDLQDSRPFVDVARRLHAAGMTVPAIHATDFERGFLLLGDLGDTTYLQAVHTHPDAIAPLYEDALNALTRIQARVGHDGLPAYDREFVTRELSLLEAWLFERHLGLTLDASARATLRAVFDSVHAAWDEQPRVFVHRDYHSRNLMVLARDNPGVLDFQDAVAGPVMYDLASLTRDVYLDWDETRIAAWLGRWRERAIDAGVTDLPGAGQCRRWLDFTATQRLVKILGLFCRLHHRDGKARYLADLPRTLAHLRAACAPHAELRPLPALLDALDVEPRLAALGK